MPLYLIHNISAQLGEIWQVVERKLKVPIPAYIKNVLKFCGYDNCHSIATIEEQDFEYVEAEVRNGGITKFFEGEIAANDVLDGSTKTEENFEIIRGHRKLLMAVVKFVKE